MKNTENLKTLQRLKLSNYVFILTNPKDFYGYWYNPEDLIRKLIPLFSGTGRFEIEAWIARILVSAIFDRNSNLTKLFKENFPLPNGSTLYYHLTRGNRNEWWIIENIDKHKKIIYLKFKPETEL